MGRFSTTVQIKNNVDRMVFVNSFRDVMKKRGFFPCSEDEASVSYLLAFGKGWVTITNDEYKDNPQKAYDDSREMAEALKTSTFSVEVVDSDFAILKLCNSDGGEDKVVVGDGSGYDANNMRGAQEHWKPLLADGKTWEQFSEIAVKNEVYVENTLSELAEILEIEPYYVCADFGEVLNRLDENENITALFFNKSVATSKVMSLNTAFKQVFGEALEPLGFKLIKSKYPYFVRVVPGGEIIHVITLLTEPSYQRGKKCFKIFGGIATVYRDEIDLTKNPGVENINWMRSNSRIAIATGTKYDFAYEGGFQEFLYEIDNESKMFYELRHSLDVTRKVMLPIISKAVDIYSSIECFFQMGVPLRFGKQFECLLFLKTERYADIFINSLQKRDDEYKEKMKQHVEGYTPEGYEIELRKSKEVIQREVSPIDEVFATPNMLAEYMAELERRRAINTEKFRSYGLDI